MSVWNKQFPKNRFKKLVVKCFTRISNYVTSMIMDLPFTTDISVESQMLIIRSEMRFFHFKNKRKNP
jgi:hypothetical protein